MDDLIKDFTPLFSKEKTAQQQVRTQAEIASLLSLLNTHQLITAGGAELYKEKGGFEKIELMDTLGYDILDHTDLAQFMSTSIANLADSAYNKGDVIIKIAQKLRDFNPDDQKSIDELGEAWLSEQKMLEEMIYLYSEYLYKVFLDNPYKPELAGIKTTEKI